MDRQSTLGFVLIAVLITGWMIYNSWNTSHSQASQQQKTDSVAQQTKNSTATPQTSPAATTQAQTPQTPQIPEKTVTVETEYYTAVISSKGMSLTRWELKGYKAWYGSQVQLVKPDAHEFALSFYGPNGQKVNAENQDFNFKNLPGTYLVLNGDKSLTIEGTLDAGNGGSITRKFTFHGNKYHVDADVQLTNMDNVLPNTQRWVTIGWEKGLQYQEHNSVDESGSAIAFASLNGSLDELDADQYEVKNAHQSGQVEFIGTKTKYFLASILNRNEGGEADYYLEGIREGKPDNGFIENYSASYRMPYRGGVQTNKYQLYVGPLDYDIVKEYGMASTINFGWKWLIRPIGEWFMLPIFKFIHSFIPNFGICIIVFAFIIRIITYPLTIGQLQSARKMKVVKPLLDDLRKKYPDDQAGYAQAQMKLLGEYGISPMGGGCMPLLLQMPILYALYGVLSNNIQMRQAGFLPFWITDLSVPDHIIPFPILGFSALSGLALIMGVSMFIQQKMTITDPNQKAMVYMMPVMMTLMFSGLPSGLNLYYLVGNVIAIVQQVWMNKFSKNQLTLADLKKMPKKEGWLQKRMRLMQEMAEEQGRTLPNNPYLQQKNGSGNTNAKKNKKK